MALDSGVMSPSVRNRRLRREPRIPDFLPRVVIGARCLWIAEDAAQFARLPGAEKVGPGAGDVLKPVVGDAGAAQSVDRTTYTILLPPR